MKNNGYSFFLLLFSILCVSCDDEGQVDPLMCDQSVVISASEYATAPRDAVTINSIALVAGCLQVNYSASGCDGSTWDTQLIDSGAVMESFPPQRNLILSINNQEACDAVITRQTSFNISELQTEGSSVWLNIVNTEDTFLYEY